MNREEMIDRLDRVTDKVAMLSIDRNTPTTVSKTITRVGSLVINKNPVGNYDISTLNGVRTYQDITVFDVAITIAQKYSTGQFHTVKQLLYFEDRFSKFRNDMIHYLNCMKGAKKKGDIERLAILEDKFQLAEESAKNARQRLLSFKTAK